MTLGIPPSRAPLVGPAAPRERSLSMLLQLLVLAVAAMVALAVLRLARVSLGRTPLPEGRSRRLFQIAFLVVPPMALGALTQPVPGSALFQGILWVPLYGVILLGLALLMGIAAVIAQLVAPVRPRRHLLVALIGSEGDPDDLPFDPPVTTQLAESMALVDRTNAVFPRGREFATQVDRPDFRAAWDALDAATGTLEGRMAEDRRLGLGVASAATSLATDARGRLDTLRSIARSRGLASAAV